MARKHNFDDIAAYEGSIDSGLTMVGWLKKRGGGVDGVAGQDLFS